MKVSLFTSLCLLLLFLFFLSSEDCFGILVDVGFAIGVSDTDIKYGSYTS